MAKAKKNEAEMELSPQEAALDAERRFEEALKKRKGINRSAENKTLISIELDVSGSMYASGAVEEAKSGLDELIKGVLGEDLLALSIELRVGVFGEMAKTARNFGPIDGCSSKSIFAELPDVGGGTSIATAAEHLMNEIDNHRVALRREGQNIRFALAFLFTDGQDCDSDGLKKASERIRRSEAAGGFRFFAIGVERADLKQLGLLSAEPVRLSNMDFSSFFRWLLPVSRALSQSQIGEQVSMPNPLKSDDNPNGWAEKYGTIG